MGTCQTGRLLAALATAALCVGPAAAPAQLPPLGAAPEPARIAFVADAAIHTIAADGSGRTRLSPDPPLHDSDPAWSPGGDQIAFTRFPTEDGDEGESARVWLVRPDGSGARPLIPSPRPDRNDTAPAWAPDGSQLAFVRFRDGDARFTVSLVVAAADGSWQRTVHSESASYDEEGENDAFAFFYAPAWSPDGERILFTRSGEGFVGAADTHPSLHVVPAAGGMPTLVARDAREGAWSPDGARIAFAGVKAGRACQGDCEFFGDISVMNADGTGRTALMESPAADEAEPTWSGDGERIVFQSDRNSAGSEFTDETRFELYSIKPDGSCLTWLTNGTAISRSPSFDPRPGLSSDPGACGPTPREPLVETDTRAAESFRHFKLLWFGRVAPNGRLLTDVSVERPGAQFAYEDCGRYDPRECGDFLTVFVQDLCSGIGPLERAGRSGSALRLARGALLHETKFSDGLELDLYSHRTLTEVHAPEGSRSQQLIGALRRPGQDQATGGALPQARLPLSVWRSLARVTKAHRRLRDVDAVARRIHVSRAEVKRRLALARRLAQLGVKRRLGCAG